MLVVPFLYFTTFVRSPRSSIWLTTRLRDSNGISRNATRAASMAAKAGEGALANFSPIR